MDFGKEKKEFLNKKDKSRKKKIDIKIKKLVDRINSLDDFYTTSSCSGRILLIAQHKSGRKDKAKWMFSSHDKVDFEKVYPKKVLKNLPKEDVWLRVEPAILHVACKSQNNAISLLNLARNIGFRRSGIISIGKNRLVLELVSTEKIDALVSKNGKLLIDSDYFKVLIREGNNKLERTWKKINRLYKEL